MTTSRSILTLLTLIFAGSAVGAVVVDNDTGSPAYTETGSWATSSSTGYNGGTYRFATAGGAHSATWNADLPEAGTLEVFVWYVPSSNRASSVKYDIVAADGTHTVFISQQSGGFTWESLGSFPFNAGPASITVDVAGSSGAAGSVVIADAVRFGGSSGGEIDPPTPVEVAPGVFHAEWSLPGPQVVDVLEFDLADRDYTIEMGFANGQRNYGSREPLTTIASRYDNANHEVVGAINCAFFDFSSIFVHGMLGSKGNVIGPPTVSGQRETYMLQGSGEGWCAQDLQGMTTPARFADGAEMQVGILNYTCGANTLALYTRDWGTTTGSSTQGVEVLVEDANLPLRANKWVSGRIASVRTGSLSVNNTIPADGFVLRACPGAENELLAHAVEGEMVSVHVGLSPLILNNGRAYCGALGWMVKDGVEFPGGFYPGFEDERHPRTVLAWSGTRHWFITFDGRQPGYSVGATFQEMANFLIDQLQVENAINLDGGGSTTMVVQGQVANCPSDGATTPCTGDQRALPNALLLVREPGKSTFPLVDAFASTGRSVPADDKFTFNPVAPFSPAPADGDGYVLELMDPTGGYETSSLGRRNDADYTIQAQVYCDYRPDAAANGFERYGLFARDDGNGNFESTSLGGGNCYALTFDSHDGRIRAGTVVDGVFTDLLETEPLYMPSSAWRRMRISCYGTEIQFSVDGAIIASTLDATHTHGRFGVGYHEYFADDGDVQGAHVDNLRAYTVDFDWDNDGDIDLADYPLFSPCLRGPVQKFAPGHVCLQMDGDGDFDIDEEDFGLFQQVFTGPGE